MSEGLRPHHHQYFEYNTESWYDEKQHCLKRKVTYMCMICGNLRHEVYDCYQPPPKEKDKSKVLNKNKKRYKG